MESAFDIIAEPNRRAILSLLVSSQQSVGEIERRLRMSQPAVSKHLRVLRDAGFVESTVDAQRRHALERHLDRMDQSQTKSRAPTRKKTNKRSRGANRERDKGETK